MVIDALHTLARSRLFFSLPFIITEHIRFLTLACAALSPIGCASLYNGGNGSFLHTAKCDTRATARGALAELRAQRLICVDVIRKYRPQAAETRRGMPGGTLL